MKKKFPKEIYLAVLFRLMRCKKKQTKKKDSSENYLWLFSDIQKAVKNRHKSKPMFIYLIQPTQTTC